jgi:hypothetical protein
MARGKRFSPEQIVAKLRQIAVQLAQGKSLAVACKEEGVGEQSPKRVPEGRDLLQLEGGSDRDRSVEGPLQLRATPLGPRLSAPCSRQPRGLCAAPTITTNHAVASHGPVQNPGQVSQLTCSSPR